MSGAADDQDAILTLPIESQLSSNMNTNLPG